MRIRSTIFLIAFGFVTQRAIATSWIDFESFSSPSNTDNHCDQAQQSGFHWDELPVGDFDSYENFDFSGFKCTNSFHDKRDILSPSFQSKCIKGTVSKHASSGPKISCSSGNRFSIKDFQISTSVDTELDLLYSYENGDVCKHTAACSKGGSTIDNSQCGGAIAVTFQLPKHVEHRDCEIGIHSVGFDCEPPSGNSSSPPKTSKTALFSSAPASSPSVPASTSSLGIAGSSPLLASSPSGLTSVESSSEYSSLAIWAPFTTVGLITSSPSTTTASSNTLVSGSTQEVVTTVKIYTLLTNYPVTNTVTSGTHQIVESSFTVSTIVTTVVSTICTKCLAPQPSTPAATPVVGVSTSAGMFPVESALPSSSESSPAAHLSSSPATTQDVVTTVLIQTTVTTGPVIHTVTSGSSELVQSSETISIIFNTITSTICTKCVAPPAIPAIPAAPATNVETSSAGVPSFKPGLDSPAPAPPLSVPSVLPKCLNTWITLTKCANNADSDCYCTDSSFTKNVQDCINSWTENADIIQAALSYLAGICAPHIPENPEIITGVLDTIALASVPAPGPATPSATGDSSTAPPPKSAPPVTIISIVQTVKLPCIFPAGISAGQRIPSSSTISLLSINVTLPQVKFATESRSEGVTGGTPNVVLAAGSPAPAPAIPTAATAISAPGPYGPVAGTTFATGVLPPSPFAPKPPANTSTGNFATGGGERGAGRTAGGVMVGFVGVVVGAMAIGF